MRHLLLIVFFIISSTAFGQQEKPQLLPVVTPVVTAASSGDHVRFTAPGNITRVRVEVFSSTGESVFDSGQHQGNLFDWRWQDQKEFILSADTYLCVVTVQSLSGKTSRKLANVSFANKQATLEPIDVGTINPAQIAALNLPSSAATQTEPAESITPLTILSPDQSLAAAVVAHDGNDGQIARTHGAFSFRVGDFFAGNDQEQMRLTEVGNLGIGTSKPKFKLDVAGTIRADRVLIAKTPGSKTDNQNATAASQDVDNVLPLASGSGTQNKIAKWTDNSGTLGDSNIFEDSNNRVGIGTTVPGARFHTVGVAGSLGAGTFQLDATTLFSNWTATYPAFEVLNTNLTNNNVSLFQFSDVASGAAHAGIGAVATNHTNKFGDLFFFTKGADGYQPRMGIYGGNVGIGTSSPGAKLDVVGDVNTSAGYNIGGSRILSSLGLNNLFAGVGAGQNNTTGINNTFFGPSAGLSNTMGNNNSFFGSSAGRLSTTGIYNSFFGVGAGYDNTGDYNSFFGAGAGGQNTLGTSNTFVGDIAGQSNTTGSYNTAIGVVADVGSGNLTNATAIGANAAVGQSNSLVLGSINGVNGATADTNVGIGTTSPIERLHVGGNAYLNNNGGTNLILDATGVAGGRKWRWVAGTASQSYGVGNGFGLFDDTASAYRLAVGPSGNVGIGTTAPSSRFHVNGTSWFQGDTTPLSSTAGAGVAIGTLGSGDGYVFSWDYGAATPKNLLLNSPGGTVGIGTVSPAERLNVGGNAYLNNNGGTNLYLDATGAGGHKWRWVAGTASESYGVGNGFGLFDDTKSEYRLAVDQFGNVGIGTTSPDASLDVNGTTHLRSTLFLDFYAGGGNTQVCRFQSAFALCSSSLRYKTNIAPFSSGLSFIKQLRPITFDWKQGGKRDVGFGAEDVAQIDPLFVTYNNKGEVEGVKYDRLAAAFVNAFKEQQAQIERQQMQLKQQQDQIDSLSKLICRKYRKAAVCH